MEEAGSSVCVVDAGGRAGDRTSGGEGDLDGEEDEGETAAAALSRDIVGISCESRVEGEWRWEREGECERRWGSEDGDRAI